MPDERVALVRENMALRQQVVRLEAELAVERLAAAGLRDMARKALLRVSGPLQDVPDVVWALEHYVGAEPEKPRHRAVRREGMVRTVVLVHDLLQELFPDSGPEP